MTQYLIINGSPRLRGKSSHVARRLARDLGQSPENSVDVVDLTEFSIGACTACDGCKKTATCIIRDDMQDVYPLLDSVDELIVVSPVFFAGPPAQLKALLDRLQCYFWSDMRTKPKRKAALYVIGDGGDPHGHDPLITIVRSSLAVAGFMLDEVHDLVGLSLEEIDTKLERGSTLGDV